MAGPAANFILAFVLMFFYFGWINEVPDIKVTRIEWVTPGSAADQAGLQAGDIIRRFDNLTNPDVGSFTDRINDAESDRSRDGGARGQDH